MVIWAILAAVVALAPPFLYLIGRIRDPFHPMIFMGLMAYFLVPSKLLFHADQALSVGNSVGIYSRYLIVTAISMLGLYAGWARSAAKAKNEMFEVAAPAQYDPQRMLVAAALFMIVSLPVHFLYTIKFDKNTSGYLVDISKMWTPAAILIIQAYFLMDRKTPFFTTVLLLIALIPPLERLWSYGQRGDMVRVAAVLGLFYLHMGKRPSKPVAIGAVALLGLVVVTLSFSRSLVTTGEASNRVEALVKVIPAFVKGEYVAVDNSTEVVFGAAEVETVRQHGPYGWGRTFTVGILIRALPRQWFPNKDEMITFHGGYNWENMKYDTGVQIAGGSAPTGFASGFAEFGWACPLIWFIYGYAFQRVWKNHLRSLDVRYMGFLVGFAVSALYATAQDLLTAEVNLIFVLLPLAVVYRVSRVRPSEVYIAQPA